MTTVPSPIGAYERPEPASAAAPEADPDLDRWQAERWAPHSTEPAPANGMRSFTRGDGSFHDLSMALDEAKAAEAAKSRGRKAVK